MAACKKSKVTSPTGTSTSFTGCRITKITQWISSDTSVKSFNSFYYNNDGTVMKIVTTSNLPSPDTRTIDFIYKVGYLLAETIYSDQSISGIDSLIIDDQNRVSAIYFNNEQGNAGYSTWTSLQYNSMGELQTVNENNSVTQTYQWQNGDLLWNDAGSDIYTYLYDTTLRNTGNISGNISDILLYGRGISVSKHLCTAAVLDNTDTIHYTYNLDSAGKITGIQETEPGNFIHYTQIEYDCQ